MKTIQIIYYGLLCCLITAVAVAMPQSEYKLLRSKQKPIPVIDAQQLKANLTSLRGKLVEVRGLINGVISTEQEGIDLLVKVGGVDLSLRTAKSSSEMRMGNRVRAICRVSPDVASNALEVTAITCDYGPPFSAAPPTTAATPAAQVQTPAPTRRYELASRSGDITTAYQRAVQYFNCRLSAQESHAIAEGVLAFSMHYGIDPRLIMAVIAAESSFNPNARSHCGAMGLGQLMPGTAAGLGVRNPYDIYQNMWGCVKLIRGHLDKYSGHPQQFALALASYNAGSGAVRKYGGVPPYRETRNYIWKIYRLYLSLLTPEERAAVLSTKRR